MQVGAEKGTECTKTGRPRMVANLGRCALASEAEGFGATKQRKGANFGDTE